MEAATEPRMVPGFRHRPGNHCGSTALRNLLAHGGLELSEEMAFGLGAGASFYYVVLEQASPTRWFNGRVGKLEENFLELTAARLALDTFEGPEEAWEAARAEVDGGRPALLLTDLYYLDHYGRSAHFPGHAVVLVGYDGESAYLADTGFEELQATSIESLKRARHGSMPVFPLDGHMVRLPQGPRLGDPREAAGRAVERAARQMLEPELGEYQGIPALRRLAADVAGWPEAADDWQWCARFAYQVIERRGTGGGNFRHPMYSGFLAEAGYAEAGLAREAGERWTGLAEAFRRASEAEEAEPGEWRAIGELSGGVLEAEERLCTALAERGAT
jgi:Butirosin biosynthesis protein H, N-terminal/Domain of unknown function (DUF4872)